MKIKIVDFDKTKHISKDFRDRVGLYDPHRKTIYLDKGLPTHNNGTRRSVLEHEKAHALIDRMEWKLSDAQEEKLAVLISVCATPSKYQSAEEVEFKKFLSHGMEWRKDSRRIIAELFRKI